MRSALRGTWLAAASSGGAARWQAPRLPLAKHNENYVSSGGPAPLRAERRHVAARKHGAARTMPEASCSWRRCRLLLGGVRLERRSAWQCPPAPTLVGAAAGGPFPPAASVRQSPG